MEAIDNDLSDLEDAVLGDDEFDGDETGEYEGFSDDAGAYGDDSDTEIIESVDDSEVIDSGGDSVIDFIGDDSDEITFNDNFSGSFSDSPEREGRRKADITEIADTAAA